MHILGKFQPSDVACARHVEGKITITSLENTKTSQLWIILIEISTFAFPPSQDYLMIYLQIFK